MRVVNRNRRPVAYAFYEGATEIIDDNGLHTGEYEVHYTDPVRALMNVSGGKGQANVRLFGIGSEFDRTIVTDDLTTPFSTDTVFWIETDPAYAAIAGEAIAGLSAAGKEHNGAFDYRVVSVARTINQVVLGLAEVEVSHAKDND